MLNRRIQPFKRCNNRQKQQQPHSTTAAGCADRSCVFQPAKFQMECSTACAKGGKTFMQTAAKMLLQLRKKNSFQGAIMLMKVAHLSENENKMKHSKATQQRLRHRTHL
jgi:hypothetical protein